MASQGEENKAVRGPQQGEPVVLRGTEPDDQENENLPDPGKPERRADRPHDGSSSARDRRGKEDRSRPGQRQVPPRQGPDRPIRPRSGPGAHHTHLHAPVRPRPWVSQNTSGTPPRTISPTSSATPQRTPSRPSPPTSPAAPSTTTSSTSQSHHHTPILFNFSHTIHAAQECEADVAFLVLGGAPDKPGAKAWVSESVSLVNVATCRAKRRIYVIGDWKMWSNFPYFRESYEVLGRVPDKGVNDPRLREAAGCLA